MENLELTQCPDCKWTQKEATIVSGNYVIVGHYCLNAEYVKAKIIGDVILSDNEIYQKETLPTNEWSEKELLVSQTEYLRQLAQATSKIYSIALFFFWVSILSTIIWVVMWLIGRN